MKLLIPKSNLAYALRRVQGAISGRAFNPWMACALIKAEGTRLLVSATNLDVQISHATDATVIEPGAALLPLESLVKFVSGFGPQDVEVEVDDKFHCKLTCGDRQGVLSGMDTKDFTPFPTQERKGFEMTQSDLKAALRKTLISAGTDEGRIVLCGVLIELEKNKLAFVACDGKRISVVKRLFDGDGIRSIVPTRGASEVMKLLDDTGDIASIQIGAGSAEFTMGDTSLVTKLIDENYPNYKRTIPEKSAYRIPINREEFLSAVKHVSWVYDPAKFPTMEMEFSKNKITLHQFSPSNEAHASVLVKYDGPEMVLKLPPEQITAALTVVSEDEVSLELAAGFHVDHPPVDANDFNSIFIKAGNSMAMMMLIRKLETA